MITSRKERVSDLIQLADTYMKDGAYHTAADRLASAESLLRDETSNRMPPITGDDILNALIKLNEQKHGSICSWITTDLGANRVTLDGFFNLNKVAKILNGETDS